MKYSRIFISLLIPAIASAQERTGVQVTEATTYDVEGRLITIERVDDRSLPVPHPVRKEDVVEGVQTFETEHHTVTTASFFLAISANVSTDGSVIRWQDSKSGEQMEAWSNVDWRLFEGISTVTLKDGTEVTLMLAAGWTEDVAEGESPAPITRGFALRKGDPSGSSIPIIAALHSHYHENKAKLRTDYDARIRASKEAEAERLANPPIPEDVVVRFRILSDEETQAKIEAESQQLQITK